MIVLAIVGGDDGHMDECKSLTNKLELSEKVILQDLLAGPKRIPL